MSSIEEKFYDAVFKMIDTQESLLPLGGFANIGQFYDPDIVAMVDLPSLYFFELVEADALDRSRLVIGVSSNELTVTAKFQGNEYVGESPKVVIVRTRAPRGSREAAAILRSYEDATGKEVQIEL